jgi:hypothetical protein
MANTTLGVGGLLTTVAILLAPVAGARAANYGTSQSTGYNTIHQTQRHFQPHRSQTSTVKCHRYGRNWY